MLDLKTSLLISLMLVAIATSYAAITAYLEPSEQKSYARILDTRAARGADERYVEATAY